MKILKSLLLACLLLSGVAHADNYQLASDLKVTSLRTTGDRVYVTLDKAGVCDTNVYSLMLTDANEQTTRTRQTMLSNLMLAASAGKSVSMEIWAACAQPGSTWGMSLDLTAITVHF